MNTSLNDSCSSLSPCNLIFRPLLQPWRSSPTVFPYKLNCERQWGWFRFMLAKELITHRWSSLLIKLKAQVGFQTHVVQSQSDSLWPLEMSFDFHSLILSHTLFCKDTESILFYFIFFFTTTHLLHHEIYWGFLWTLEDLYWFVARLLVQQTCLNPPLFFLNSWESQSS